MLIPGQIKPGILKLTIERVQSNFGSVLSFVRWEKNGNYCVVFVGHLSFNCRSYCGRSRPMQDCSWVEGLTFTFFEGLTFFFHDLSQWLLAGKLSRFLRTLGIHNKDCHVHVALHVALRLHSYRSADSPHSKGEHWKQDIASPYFWASDLTILNRVFRSQVIFPLY